MIFINWLCFSNFSAEKRLLYLEDCCLWQTNGPTLLLVPNCRPMTWMALCGGRFLHAKHCFLCVVRSLKEHTLTWKMCAESGFYRSLQLAATLPFTLGRLIIGMWSRVKEKSRLTSKGCKCTGMGTNKAIALIWLNTPMLAKLGPSWALPLAGTACSNRYVPSIGLSLRLNVFYSVCTHYLL